MSIRFAHSDVREMGRQAYGVNGIRLDEGDYVVSMIASNNENDLILTVTEGGFGKRTAVEEYRTQAAEVRESSTSRRPRRTAGLFQSCVFKKQMSSS
jgi:DNA gyrase/topoisomerase IV subunit A